MILDERLTFGVSTDLDAEASTVLAANQIDLGSAPTLKDIGNGQPVYAYFVVTEAFTDGGDSATLTVKICSDDTASIHATTSTVHYASAAMLKAALTIGKKWCVPLPVEATYERYLGVNYVIETAGFDAGMITSGLTLDPTGYTILPDGI